MTKKRNRYVLFLLTVSMASAGCAADRELADARLDADECRLELQTLRAKLDQQDGGSLIRAQRDQLAAENEYLKRELAQIRERERQLRKNLGITKTESPKAAEQIAAQREELKRALANLRRSRDQWESSLAERQRRIDVLTHQIQRLVKELQAARDAAHAATQPRSR